MIDWGNKCFHCGSDKHTREQCQSFAKMLAEAPHNKGKEKSKHTPPPGYKSALGKARDAARAAEKKKPPVAALREKEAEDTASDNDSEYSMVGRKFTMHALRPPLAPATKESQNKFAALDVPAQEYDQEMIDSLNSLTNNKVTYKKLKTKVKRTTN